MCDGVIEVSDQLPRSTIDTYTLVSIHMVEILCISNVPLPLNDFETITMLKRKTKQHLDCRKHKTRSDQ